MGIDRELFGNSSRMGQEWVGNGSGIVRELIGNYLGIVREWAWIGGTGTARDGPRGRVKVKHQGRAKEVYSDL